MTTFLRFLAALPGILLLSTGVRWIVTPPSVAMEFNMPLLEGMARSTQIGDLGAFFSGSGLFILIGVVTLERTWLHAGAIMMLLVASFRTGAWALHDAELATQAIVVELVTFGLALALSARLKMDEGSE